MLDGILVVFSLMLKFTTLLAAPVVIAVALVMVIVAGVCVWYAYHTTSWRRWLLVVLTVYLVTAATLNVHDLTQINDIADTALQEASD